MRSVERQRTFTELARRRQIVEAAIELLAEHGYGGASLAGIAGRIGVSKGVLSYHFAGKQELLEQVVDTVAETAQAFMAPRVEAARPGRGRLRAYIESNLEWMAGNRSEIVALLAIFDAAPRGREGQPAFYAVHYQGVVARLEEHLRDGQLAGDLRAFPTRAAAVSIRAAIDAGGYRLGDEPGFDVAAYGRELADFFDHAVRADATAEES